MLKSKLFVFSIATALLTLLQATGQVFELTPEQRQYLLNNGVSQYMGDQMPNLNRTATTQVAPAQPSTVPQPQTTLPQPQTPYLQPQPQKYPQ